MSSNSKTSPTTGPEIAEPEGLVDLTKFSQRAGLDAGLHATKPLADMVLHRSWEYGDAVDVNAWALTRSYLEGLDKLLADEERSQFAYFDFKHFCKLKKTATKDHMVRVRAQLYQTQEGAVWVHLMLAPTRH